MAKKLLLTNDGKYQEGKKLLLTVDGSYRGVKKVLVTRDGVYRLAYQGGIDISAATATAADVLKGYTFFGAGSEEMQTGTSTALSMVTGSQSTSSSTSFSVTCGFKPKYVIVWGVGDSSHNVTDVYNNGSKFSLSRNGSSGDFSNSNQHITVSSTGFSFSGTNVYSVYISKLYYVAIG